MFRMLVIVAALLGAQAIARADVYRWVDAQGRVQYSDRWVPGSELVKVDKSKQNPDANCRAANRRAEQARRLQCQRSPISRLPP